MYASRTSLPAARYLIGRNDALVVHRVVGVVLLWGTVYEGVGGWRGEYAYAERLWVPHAGGADEIARQLAVYRVPVTTLAAPAGAAAVAEIGSLA